MHKVTAHLLGITVCSESWGQGFKFIYFSGYRNQGTCHSHKPWVSVVLTFVTGFVKYPCTVEIYIGVVKEYMLINYTSTVALLTKTIIQ